MAGSNKKKNDGAWNKKLKPINRVWRPITAQPNSREECSLNVKAGSEPEFPSDGKYCASTSVSSAQIVTEAITEATSSGGPSVSTVKHSVSVKVGASLIRFVKGTGGATQKKVEEEMGVTIVFPSSWKEDSVIIEGVSVDSIAKASARIQEIIDQAVKSPSLEYSHFISLPLAIHPELVDQLFTFQNSILGCGDAPTSSKSSAPSGRLKDTGIEKSIFINPKTFHLTVLMLKLWNKERVDAAYKVLQSVSSQVMEALVNRPLSIRLRGLDCMKGSLAQARVVYAPVEEIGSEGRLLRACQVIIDAFVRAGLVMEKDANQSLKLHATVMNARHRTRVQGRQTMDYFDARPIFEHYGSKDWGEYVIHEAHLSQRFANDDNGYYHCCGSIPFP